MNLNKFTQRSIEAIQSAQQMAQEAQNPQVVPEHLLLALLQKEEGLVPQLIKKLGVYLEDILRETEEAVTSLPKQEGGQVYASNEFSQVL
ncbi:type VI secretion system ATPase TssH, partial [candidate division GN15 bacterium]|nr:type VI secretion system ATPase TssH [candidate division GN15 bacterium]